MKIPANLQTYKSRVWTRAKQVSFSCKSCASKRFTMTANFGEVPEGRTADVAALLQGEMTCCTRKHHGGGPCDKESFMLLMLGMYCDQSIKQSFRHLHRRLSSQPKTENAHPNSEAAHVPSNSRPCDAIRRGD